jgi:hypothetical protein
MELAATLDPDGVLRNWTGPDNGRIDFTGVSAGVEVKATTTREQLLVEIHGLSQLDSRDLEELYLYLEQLEPVPIGGDCVPDAVSRLRTAGVDTVGLLRSLAKAGYRQFDAEAYRHIRFQCLQRRTYATTYPGFPRLTPGLLGGQRLPERIIRLRYTIDLTDSESIPGLVKDPLVAVAHLLREDVT